jgi:hypothetical protein
VLRVAFAWEFSRASATEDERAARLEWVWAQQLLRPAANVRVAAPTAYHGGGAIDIVGYDVGRGPGTLVEIPWGGSPWMRLKIWQTVEATNFARTSGLGSATQRIAVAVSNITRIARHRECWWDYLVMGPRWPETDWAGLVEGLVEIAWELVQWDLEGVMDEIEEACRQSAREHGKNENGCDQVP